MIATLTVVLFVYVACALGQTMSTESPSHTPAIPFMDLITGASNYYSEPVRKVFAEQDYSVSCHKQDTLTSFANVLGSAAKIMISAAVILSLKFIAGKLMLLPLLFVLLGKLGLKTFLLWPMISKMMKYYRTKHKKYQQFQGRTITDCSQRIACVIQRSSKEWGSNLGAAVTFSLIEDIDEDNSYTKAMLRILAGDKVAKCLSVNCDFGSDIR